MVSQKEWFDKCAKVPWQPPNYAFKVVWPILYILYIIVIVLQFNQAEARKLLLIGLALNLCWVPLYILNVKAALLLIVIMIIVGVKTLQLFWKKNRMLEFYLFALYVAWISFASTMNAYLAWKC